MRKRTVELLRKLTELDGVSGYESEVSDFIQAQLKGVAEFEKDNLGSIICKKKGTVGRPRIMMPAHMDEVGFMVKDVHESGCLKFAPLGGWLDQNLLSHVVTVKTRSADLPGIIAATPPHLMPPEDRDKVIKQRKMFVDVGASDAEDARENFGIKIGDPIVPRQPFTVMKNEKYMLAKAWDDRVGCGLMIEVIRALKGQKHANSVFGVGTVQEEVGTRGAETAADVVDPDFCIVLEVGLATDVPGAEGEVKTSLGKGPIIYVMDGGTIAHHHLKDFILGVADKKKIPYQLSLLERGATDARAIHLHARGVPSIDLGVPTRYIHGHAGIIHADDYDATLRLAVEVVKALTPSKARAIMA